MMLPVLENKSDLEENLTGKKAFGKAIDFWDINDKYIVAGGY